MTVAALTNPGAQWTARPTLTLRLWAAMARSALGCRSSATRDGRAPLGRFGARPSWPQVFCHLYGRAPANSANGNRTDA